MPPRFFWGHFGGHSTVYKWPEHHSSPAPCANDPFTPALHRPQRNDLARATAEVLGERHALRAERDALASERQAVREIRQVRAGKEAEAEEPKRVQEQDGVVREV